MRTKGFAAPVALAVALSVVPAMADAIEATVYKSPECGCCHVWVGYLRDNGFDVRITDMDDVTPVKYFFRIPGDLWACHTAVIGGYAVEGHVPVEAIDRLLAEKPQIKGIALPGMPSGSPGMPGPKTEKFIIYTISDTKPAVFMVQ